jgi:DNA invertase Pin-like site-specific DNA recombinase
MIRQRVRAGLRRAVARGKVLGRPKLDAELEQRIRAQAVLVSAAHYRDRSMSH